MAWQPATREQELKAAVEKAVMPPADYRLYGALLARTKWDTAVLEDRYQPRSLGELAKWTHMSEASVKRSLNHLQRHGWLLRHRHFSENGIGGRGHRTTYQLDRGRDCDCTKKGAQFEPVSEQKGAQIDPRKGLTGPHVSAGQPPVPAKRVNDVREVGRESGFNGLSDEQQMRDIATSWGLDPIAESARRRRERFAGIKWNDEGD